MVLPFCYGSVKSWLMTRYLFEFMSLIDVGPRWGQRLYYAKILKAPCERLETVGFCSLRGFIYLGKYFGVRL